MPGLNPKFGRPARTSRSRSPKNVHISKSYPLSVEYIVESDSEEIEDVSSGIAERTASIKGLGVRPSPQTLVHQRSPTPAVGSSHTSSDPMFGKKKKTPSSVSNRNSSEIRSVDKGEGSSSESPSENGTGSSDDVEVEMQTGILQVNHTPSKPLQPLHPYKPPHGFEVAPTALSPSSRLQDIFSPSYLEGKQLWHITIPASVAIETLTEVSLRSVRQEEAALSYKGVDYGFVEGIGFGQPEEKILVLGPQTIRYRPIRTKFARTLRLQQVVHLSGRPSGSKGAQTGAQNEVNPQRTYKKLVRQQPEGLKMRYHPFGDTSGSKNRGVLNSATSSGSDERRDRASQFRVPVSMDAMQQQRKRKHDRIDSGRNDHIESLNKPQKKRSKVMGNSIDDDTRRIENAPITASLATSEEPKHEKERHKGLESINGKLEHNIEASHRDARPRKEKKRRKKEVKAG